MIFLKSNEVDVVDSNEIKDTPAVESEAAVETPKQETKVKKNDVKVEAQVVVEEAVSQVIEVEPERNLEVLKKYYEVSQEVVTVRLVDKKKAVYQGDMIVGELKEETDVKSGRIKPFEVRLWPTTQIPFVIDKSITNSRAIEEALEYYTVNTPIKFKPLTNEKIGIRFVWHDEMCASLVGFWGRVQNIYINDKCGFVEVVHEIMHALGFIHEQSREDRDNYIQVNWENIQEGLEDQFAVVPKAWRPNDYNEDFRFDYQSVMLYPSRAFSKSPNLKTIESLGNQEISPSKTGLSPQDLERLFFLYGDID